MLIDKFISFIKREKPNYSPKIILDVGSRDLQQTLEFLSVYPDAFIIAFEPNPYQEKEIRQKIDNYNITYPNAKILFYPVALGNKEEIATLHSPPQDQNHGAGSLLKPHYSAIVHDYNKYEVQVRKLKNILDELKINKVDILWADAQGFEIEIMKGMEDILSSVDFIHVEATKVPYYDDHPTIEVVTKFLQNNNFTIKEFDVPCPPHPYGEGDLFIINNNLI
jgi:FkbM family methyltransferase